MVSDKDFVHLHLHSEMSALDGFGHIKEYVDKVVSLGQGAMGLSDHGNTFGAYQLVRHAKEAGITPIPGNEFYVAPQNPDGAFRKESVFYGPNGQKADKYDVSSKGAYTHQTIFAINNIGLKNLFKLTSLSNDSERFFQKPRIDFNMLAEYSEGLVVLTGCPSSEVSTRFLLGQDKEAYEYANRLKEVFGDRLFVEIMEHNMNSPIERLLLPKQMELSRKMGIPLVATNDAHYTNSADAKHHEEMLAAQSKASMFDETWDNGGPRFAFDGNQYYIKSAQEMAELFPARDYPNALSNTLLIAEMAQDNIALEYDPNLKPQFTPPKGFAREIDFFDHLIEEGFKVRYGNAPAEVQKEARDKIAYEREIIYSSNYIGYFLTVWDYLNYAKDNYSVRDEAGKILASSIGVGRGSVGGSILAFLLFISEIDPIRWGTIFARFMSEGRGDTYEIEYDDGTTELVVASETRHVKEDGSTEGKYIHELRPGDTVEFSPESLPSSDDAEQESKVDMESDTEEIAEREEIDLPDTISSTVYTAKETQTLDPDTVKETDDEPFTEPIQPRRQRKERPIPQWVDLGAIPESDLADLSKVAF